VQPVEEEPAVDQRDAALGATWIGDRAMGIELEAVDIEAELEWAESQGRQGDVRRLRQRLTGVLGDLADATDVGDRGPQVRIRARRAGEAA
jgi:hypothetical protein